MFMSGCRERSKVDFVKKTTAHCHRRGIEAILAIHVTIGYARNAIVHHGKLDPSVEVIMKPFTYAGLAAKIRKVLSGPAAEA